MSSAKMKPPDLLKCTDGEFDSGIQHLGLKVIDPPNFLRKKNDLYVFYTRTVNLEIFAWWKSFQILCECMQIIIEFK